jgi:hypothetical protein
MPDQSMIPVRPPFMLVKPTPVNPAQAEPARALSPLSPAKRVDVNLTITHGSPEFCAKWLRRLAKHLENRELPSPMNQTMTDGAITWTVSTEDL